MIKAEARLKTREAKVVAAKVIVDAAHRDVESLGEACVALARPKLAKAETRVLRAQTKIDSRQARSAALEKILEATKREAEKLGAFCGFDFNAQRAASTN